VRFDVVLPTRFFSLTTSMARRERASFISRAFVL
jgi:hypothetical protein